MTDLGPRSAGCTIVEKVDEQLEEDSLLILVQQAGKRAPREGRTRFDEGVVRLRRRTG